MPRRAILVVLLSGFLNSFGGLIVRSLDGSTEWQIVFYRGGSLAVALLIFLFRRRIVDGLHDFKRVGVWGVICGVFFCNMQTLFIIALSNTTVANTSFILSSGPIVTAVLARLALGETVKKSTMAVLLVVVAGVSLMVMDGLATGNVFGDLAAVGAMLSLAGFVVTLRAKRQIDMLPSLVIGGLLAALISGGAVRGAVAVPLDDLLLCVFWGGVLSAVVLVLFTSAARHLNGAVVMVLLMVEYFLGPLWVWLFIGERPSQLALIGGAIILSGVLCQAYISRQDTQTTTVVTS
jgi:drug/metabolite transporter (DMT)-like permease